jgi:type II secretory pathway component GspD/PulD (secretin)
VTTPDGWVIFYYPVNFVEPATLKLELDKWKSTTAVIEPLGGGPARPTNVLRIQERPENLPLLEKMLEILDQPLPQVLVRARLVEVTYDGTLDWGFEAAFDRGDANAGDSSETFFRGGTGTFSPEFFLNRSGTAAPNGMELAFSFLGDTKDRYGSLDYLVRFLKSKGKAEILGEPNILATQGLAASLDAGERVPVQSSTFNGATLVVSTRYEETGIKLVLTPELIGRNAVRMKLKEEFSAVTGFVAGPGGIQNPVINKRTAETTVTIRDGSTLVVGGLQSSRTREVSSGIPLLMDIPLVGALFSTNTKQETKTELYFFVTPEIIRGSYGEGVITPPGEKMRLGN